MPRALFSSSRRKPGSCEKFQTRRLDDFVRSAGREARPATPVAGVLPNLEFGLNQVLLISKGSKISGPVFFGQRKVRAAVLAIFTIHREAFFTVGTRLPRRPFLHTRKGEQAGDSQDQIKRRPGQERRKGKAVSPTQPPADREAGQRRRQAESYQHPRDVRQSGLLENQGNHQQQAPERSTNWSVFPRRFGP